MTDILVKFRRESRIDSDVLSDDIVIDEMMVDALARFNRVMNLDEEIDDLTYSTGDDQYDLAICYLTISGAFRSEYTGRMVDGMNAPDIWDQMAYAIMMEIDPSKIAQRPPQAGGGYYPRYEGRGKPYNKVYIQAGSN